MSTPAVVHHNVHYKGCWRVHHACAVAEVERLQAEVAAMGEVLTLVQHTLHRQAGVNTMLDRLIKRLNHRKQSVPKP